MDIRDFLKKVDNIQNKEQMKEDVKRIHVKEASQVMLYGDTPEDMNAIAQIFKSAGVTPPAPVEGPKPEAEEVPATEKFQAKQTQRQNLNTKTQVICRKILQAESTSQKKCTEKIIQVIIQWLLRQKKKLILSKKNTKSIRRFQKKRLAERPLTKPEKRKVTHYKRI